MSLFFETGFEQGVVLLVGLDDALHQLVAHYVFLAKLNLANALDAIEHLQGLDKSEVTLRGRSICVTSPVTTIFDPMPRRVRNILIW